MTKPNKKALLNPVTPPAPTMPAGIVLVDDQEVDAPPALVAAVLAGWAAKQEHEAAKAKVKACDDAIMKLLADHGHGPAAVVVPHQCRSTWVYRQSVKIVDADRLAQVLTDRFADLVTTTISHKAEEKLVSMATDADHPLQPAIAACLALSVSDAVTWRAEK